MSNPYTPPTDVPQDDSFVEAELEAFSLRRATCVLRCLVVAEISLSVGSEFVNIATESLLPAELWAYQQAAYDADLTTKDLILMAISLPFLMLMIVSSVGLFVFWRPARLLYLMRIIAEIVISPFFGPYVDAGWGEALGGAAYCVAGVILALVYYSPLTRLFEQRWPPI